MIKTFVDNISPVLNIIDTSVPATAPEAVEAGIPTVNKLRHEVKTRRLQLIFKPSLYQKIKKLADLNGSSVNDTIHTLLEEATKEK